MQNKRVKSQEPNQMLFMFKSYLPPVFGQQDEAIIVNQVAVEVLKRKEK